MFQRFVLAMLVLLCGALCAQAQAPANVVLDGECGTGWVGCPVAVAVPSPDGGFTCMIGDIAITSFTGNEVINLIPNDAHGNALMICRNRLDFGQANPTGLDGSGGDWIALKFQEARQIFPSAFQGNGAAVINQRTLPGVGTCEVNGVISLNYQSVVTRRGNVNLSCFLPDPSQGD